MKNIESFQHELNEMFSEFYHASSIVIGFNTCKSGNHLKDQNLPRLMSVNGYKSFREFAAGLAYMRSHLIGKIIELITDFDLRDKRAFLQQAIGFSRRLTTFTIPASQPSVTCNSTSLPSVIFRIPSFNRNGTEEIPGVETREYLLTMTRRYASFWQMQTEELIRELFCFLYQVEFWPALSPPPDSAPTRERIPVKTSVQALAALGRLFYDHRAFDLNNKEKFCRLVAASFCTVRQQKISAGSLRNHFDAPTPSTLDYIVEELRKMMQKSRRLYRVN